MSQNHLVFSITNTHIQYLKSTTMSSIFQQEFKKSAPKSPIPRSHSDFNYIGLQSKEKRWTTDFSLLLPAFSRDSTGYSRLTEMPVTLQPRTKTSNVKLTKSSTLDSSTLCSSSCNNETFQLAKNPTSDSTSSRNQTTQPKSRIHNPFNTDTTESSRRDPLPQQAVFSKAKNSLITLEQPCRHHLKQEYSIRRSPTVDPKILHSPSPSMTPNIICRSPTLDPTVLTRSPKEANRWPPSADAKVMVNRSPLCGCSPPVEVVRSQSLRSLRRPSDKSPSKIRNSESAQSDVTGFTLKPTTVAETDELEDEEDLCRLRHFSVTPKGLINWGDSFRSHSLTSVHPTSSNDGSQWDIASTRSYPLANSNSQWSCNKAPLRYKVAIMGLEEVGKTSLIRQFQTSEYICAFDTNYDVSNDYVITVILNEEESELEFLEYRCPDEEDEKHEKDSDIPIADAHVIVYSVTNRRSFLRALDLLSLVQKTFRRSAVLLVGNKSDLVRVRAVTTDEGQTAAKDKGTSFIETSAAINHQVDELLVSILAQIRTKTKSSTTSGRWSGPNGSSSLSKAKGLIKKFLKKACFQSKSCDNLQRL